MVNVVCVKQGTFYGPEYVMKLESMVRRNTTLPFRFVCFTEKREGIADHIECRPLPYHLRGWWCKIPLFAPPQCIEDEQIVCMDLDIVINGNIDWLLAYRGNLLILHAYWKTVYNVDAPKYYNGSLWSLKPGYATHVWENFAKCGDEVMKRCYSDQEYIGEQVPNADIIQQMFPGEVMGFNTHYWNLKPEERSFKAKSMWIFHGFPKPLEVCKKIDWVGEHWQ
jgi:hypothetical protein